MDSGQAFLLLETAATAFGGRAADRSAAQLPAPDASGQDAFPRYEAARNRRFALVILPGEEAAGVISLTFDIDIRAAQRIVWNS